MKNKYDVIIIGAGIGGLVCGCYLAKAGMKVLMLEQHKTPGGYCSSFKRNGFTFDSSIHYIKFKEKKSLMSKIIDDFNIKDYVTFKKLDPSDLIITPDGEFYVTSDTRKSIENLIDLFPAEKKNIESFFDFLNTKSVAVLYSKTRNKNLAALLRLYFKDKTLVSVFNCLLMNIGLPMDKVSALKAYYFFKEFFFNQSYYPKGGMQKFADAFTEAFRKYGGTILYSSEANKIVVKNNKCQGVIFNDTFMPSIYIVSNTDPHNTFLEFIGKDKISQNLYRRIKKMEPSIPALNVYFGLTNKAKYKYPINNSIWYFPSSDFSKIYDNIDKGRLIVNDDYLICSFPSSHDPELAPGGGITLAVFSGASFNTEKYWNAHKKKFAEIIMERIKIIFPNISDCLKVLSIATPYTLYRYTRNFKGACYGLASIEQQMQSSFMPQKTEIENLFMAGHWTTHGVGQGGVSMVAFSGSSAAKRILKIKKKEKE